MCPQSTSLPPPVQPVVQVSCPPSPLPDHPVEDEPPAQKVVEVAIPHVGTFVIESEEGGYDDEVSLARPLCSPPSPHASLPV